MREILFRGKRVNNGEWVEGGIIPLDVDSGYVFIAEPYLSASTLPVYEIVKNHTHLVKPESVGQYTGLTDKNGKKIFEGDICKNIKTGEIVSVKWHGTMAGYVWSKKKKNHQHLFDFGELFRAYDKYKIIGNIHDNPELLERSENGT